MSYQIVIEETETNVIEVLIPGPQGPSGSSTIEGVTGLQAALDGKQPTGDYISEGDARLSDARPPTAHTQAASTITDFEAAILAYLGTINAGGVLSGDLLAPGFLNDMVYQSELTALLGAALGIAELGADGKIKGSQIPQALLGATRFMGFWDASTNSTTPDLGALGAATEDNRGQYWIVAVDGNTELDGITAWSLGDWVISLGSQWGKVDNTDAVISVAGKTGIVTLAVADITGLQAALDLKANASAVSNLDNTSDANKPVSTATQTALDGKAPLTPGWNEQTGTTYTAALTDVSKTIRCTNAASIALTIPPNSTAAFPVGTILEVCQGGAGKVTITAGAGVTIECPATNKRTTAANAGATLKKRDTDVWWLEGRLE